MRERILLVEDDASLRETTALLLERAGYEVDAVGDGSEALSTLVRSTFDLLILDVLLPSVDGLEVCRQVRRSSSLPIVMLTARADTTDVVVGLELGADDYVTKPFDGAELVARIRAALRRVAPEAGSDVLRAGDLDLDLGGFRVSRHGAPISLTTTEFKLLVDLVRNAGQVMTRSALLQRVWGYDYLGDTRLVDMAVKRLRDKLGDDARAPTLISTVRGVGYRFDGS